MADHKLTIEVDKEVKGLGRVVGSGERRHCEVALDERLHELKSAAYLLYENFEASKSYGANLDIIGARCNFGKTTITFRITKL